MSLSKQPDPIANVCDKGLRQYPHRYPVPRFHTTFPFKRNPMDITHEHRMREWVYWLYPCSQLSMDKFLKFETSTILTCYFFGFPVSEHRYADLIKIMTMFFILDDHTDNPTYGDVARDMNAGRVVWGQFRALFDELSGAVVPMNAWKSYVVGVYPVFKQVYQFYDEDQRRRFVTEWQSYCDGCQRENQVLSAPESQPLSVQQYMDIRVKSIGMRPSVQLYEYAYDYRLPNADWDDPDVQELINMTTVYSVFLNDLFSFEKELQADSGQLSKVFNSVALTVINDKISVSESMARIAHRLMILESDIYNMVDKLTDRDVSAGGCSPELKQLMQYLLYSSGGQYKMSSVWDRYHRFNKYA